MSEIVGSAEHNDNVRIGIHRIDAVDKGKVRFFCRQVFGLTGDSGCTDAIIFYNSAGKLPEYGNITVLCIRSTDTLRNTVP